MPQRERGVIELGRQQCLNVRSKEIERRRFDRFGDDRDVRIMDFHTVWRLLYRGDLACHGDDELKWQSYNLGNQNGIVNNDLRQGLGVTKDEKADAAELAKAVNPAGERDVFSHMACNIDRPD